MTQYMKIMSRLAAEPSRCFSVSELATDTGIIYTNVNGVLRRMSSHGWVLHAGRQLIDSRWRVVWQATPKGIRAAREGWILSPLPAGKAKPYGVSPIAARWFSPARLVA